MSKRFFMGSRDAGTPSGKDRVADRALYVASLRAFAERIGAELEIATPDAVLAEGAPAMGGDGFQVLRPIAERVAIGGTNPVSVDKVGAQLLGLWDNATLGANLGGHRTSPLIDVARKRYKLDLEAIELEGDGAELLASPRPVHFKAMAPVAYVSTPNVLTLAPEGAEKYDNPWHLREYRADEFRGLCESVYENVDLYGLFHARKLRAHELALRAGWDRMHAALGITKPFYDRFTPAISARDFVLRRDDLDRALDFVAVLR